MATIEVTVPGQTVQVGKKDTVLINIPGGGSVTIEAADDKTDDFDIDFGDDDNVSDEAIVDLSAFSENNLHIDIEGYDPSDCIRILGAFNIVPDPGKDNALNFEYIGADSQTYTGFIHAKGDETDWDGIAAPIICICLTKGTLVATENGEVPVEDLKVGDLVITADNGLQAIRWVGRKYISGARMYASPEVRPVRIKKDAFGENVPERDMLVSPQHRMMVQSRLADAYFGESEVLAPAKGLINNQSIFLDKTVSSVEYFHILFDRHELIFANGTLTESFHRGLEALWSLEIETRKEILALFPELKGNGKKFGPTARRSLRPSEASALFR